jgi:hypothetical protein
MRALSPLSLPLPPPQPRLLLVPSPAAVRIHAPLFSANQYAVSSMFISFVSRSSSASRKMRSPIGPRSGDQMGVLSICRQQPCCGICLSKQTSTVWVRAQGEPHHLPSRPGYSIPWLEGAVPRSLLRRPAAGRNCRWRFVQAGTSSPNRTHLDKLLLCFFTPDVFGIRDALNNIFLSLACDASHDCCARPPRAARLLLSLVRRPAAVATETACCLTWNSNRGKSTYTWCQQLGFFCRCSTGCRSQLLLLLL